MSQKNFIAKNGITTGNVTIDATTANITGANVVTANYFSGNGGNLTGIAASNVSGLGNLALLSKDGNASNVLYGNGVFAPASGGGGGSYGDANVQELLSNGTYTGSINAQRGDVYANTITGKSLVQSDNNIMATLNLWAHSGDIFANVGNIYANVGNIVGNNVITQSVTSNASNLTLSSDGNYTVDTTTYGSAVKISGANSGFVGGTIELKAGIGSDIGGNVDIISGASPNAYGASGNIFISTPDADYQAGAISVLAGNGGANGFGGDISITAGAAIGAPGGSISITAGNGAVGGGHIVLKAGSDTGPGPFGQGYIELNAQNPDTGNLGNVVVFANISAYGGLDFINRSNIANANVITANYFRGDGSNLYNVSSTYGDSNVSTLLGSGSITTANLPEFLSHSISWNGESYIRLVDSGSYGNFWQINSPAGLGGAASGGSTTSTFSVSPDEIFFNANGTSGISFKPDGNTTVTGNSTFNGNVTIGTGSTISADGSGLTGSIGTTGMTDVAIGQSAFVPLGSGAIAIGAHATATGLGSISLSASNASGYNAIAIGGVANASGANSIVIGTFASTLGSSANSVIIGLDSGGFAVPGESVVLIGAAAGAGNSASGTSVSAGDFSVAIGTGSQTSNSANAISIGHYAYVTDATSGIAIGTGSSTLVANSVAIGAGAISGFANTIVLSGSGGLTAANAGVYIDSVRAVTEGLPSGFYQMAYNPQTGEIIYWS